MAPTPSAAVATRPSAPPVAPKPSTGSGLELLSGPTRTSMTGGFANNAWLQELPKPMTKSSGKMLHTSRASDRRKAGPPSRRGNRSHLSRTQHPCALVGLAGHGGELRPGHARLRSHTRRKGRKRVGLHLHQLAQRMHLGRSWTEVRATGPSIDLRPPRSTTQWPAGISCASRIWRRIGKRRTSPKRHTPSADQTLYPPYAYEGNAWGMAIDLNACVGCSVCTIACQAENNIPVVGRDQVAKAARCIGSCGPLFQRNRRAARHPAPAGAVHALRECALRDVCPVAATLHDHEGLNAMVYNRCIGTRYCSNNCPTKSAASISSPTSIPRLPRSSSNGIPT